MTLDTDSGIEDAYDVVVIGGGAAGLSGGVTLGRARRSVLVVDAGEPRNAPAAGVHNYLGLDGISPHALVAAGRARSSGTAESWSMAGSSRPARPVTGSG